MPSACRTVMRPMRLLALLLQVWLLQVQRLHGERAETTDGPGSPGGLVTCRDLREPLRILREGRDETATGNDIREFLWPMPRTVALQQQGRHVEDSELSGLQPLRVDPCAMAFNLTGARISLARYPFMSTFCCSRSS